jgi:hypothetical protein
MSPAPAGPGPGTASPRRRRWLWRLSLVLLVGLLLLATYLWAALSWSYSSGERAGWVQKLSKKGWLCKTWEGELALVSLPGTTPEKFLFTVWDDAVAAEITRVMGKRVALHYEQKKGLPGSCFGETRHWVTGLTVSDEIPLAPGVMVPHPLVVPPAASAPPAR